MESKIITLNIKRPKTREELRQERQTRVLVGVCVVVLILTVIVCLLSFALAFLGAANAAEAEVTPVRQTAAAPAPEALLFIAPADKEDLTLPEVADAPAESAEPDIDPEELELLALVIYQEAGGNACSDDTRRMVAEVALNRVADERFPDTLEGVLLQEGQYGRLSWTGIRWPDRAELPQEADAVARAYRIAEEVLTSDERILPEDVIFQSEFSQGVETVAESNGFYFCRG